MLQEQGFSGSGMRIRISRKQQRKEQVHQTYMVGGITMPPLQMFMESAHNKSNDWTATTRVAICSQIERTL